MKISLVGLSGCGKTSIYLTTLGGMTPNETRDLGPTVMHDVKSHNYLGLEISLWDFGGQEEYRQSYFERPQLLTNTTALIFVLDLHQPEQFDEANRYFTNVYKVIQEGGGAPTIYVFYHKYDTEDYFEAKLKESLVKAKALPFIKEYTPQAYITSIYRQDELSDVFRQILIADFKELQDSVQKAQENLAKLNSKIIVSDVNGNVITHNIKGFATGIQLREDLRDYILACNVIRENFLTTDSANFSAVSEVKRLDLHVFNYVLSVMIMLEKGAKLDDPNDIKSLLKEMEIFANVILEASKED
ncbi:ADP-ribosylation factor-like protein [Candidatus Hodarchaeum mangrovi]